MAEAANVRLVLCPKCEELLPELPEFSLYKCGGCGAVLKAKGKGFLENGLPRKAGDAEVDSTVKVSKDGVAGEKLSVDHGDVTVLDEERISSRDEIAVIATDCHRKGTGKGVNFHGISRCGSGLCSQDNKKPAKKSDFNVDRPEYAYFHENAGAVRSPVDSAKTRPAIDRWDDKNCESGPSRVHSRGPSGQGRINGFHCHEGLSGDDMSKYFEQVLSMGAARPENLELDRMDLLRRLDELRDQLSRTSGLADKYSYRFGPDGRIVSPASPFCCGRHVASAMASSPKQALVSDEKGPPYFSHPSNFAPCTKIYSPQPQEIYAQRGGCSHEMPLYGEHCQHEMLWRPSSCYPQQMQQAYDHRLPRFYGESNQDLYLPHRHENMLHQDMCSCRHCCGNSHHRSSVVDHQLYRAQNINGSTTFEGNLHPITHVSQPVDSRDSRLHSLHQRSLWSSNELDSGNDASNYLYKRKPVASHGNKQVSLPVAGGAPFITCYNCLELVKLPRKHMISMGKKPQKIKCGACSSLIFLETGDKEIVSPVSALVDQIPTEIDEGSVDTTDENIIYWNDDSADSQHKLSEADKNVNSFDFEGPLNPVSSTSTSSHSPENRLSAAQSHSHENGSSLGRSTSLPKSTEEDRSVIDVPSKDHSNGYASQDSAETDKDSHPKVIKVESFLSSFMKKSFKDSKKPNQNGGEVKETQVFVNGHLILDHAVKKAEKLAGPIQPGDYWYDKKAGFWGVMGHPCLGIIMPNIEEFSHPIPADCAAGNTSVYVNGRELHQNDLDLLASRGLPITRNRSYLIEINGDVVDEQTGDKLEGLGKLAPTVERAKHGFGMKVPRFISQPQS